MRMRVMQSISNTIYIRRYISIYLPRLLFHSYIQDKEVEESLETEYDSMLNSTGRDPECGMTYEKWRASKELQLDEIKEQEQDERDVADHVDEDYDDDEDEHGGYHGEHEQTGEKLPEQHEQDDDDEDDNRDDLNRNNSALEPAKTAPESDSHLSEDNKDSRLPADSSVSATNLAGKRSYKKWKDSDEDSEGEGVTVAVETMPDIPLNKLEAATGDSARRRGRNQSNKSMF